MIATVIINSMSVNPRCFMVRRVPSQLRVYLVFTAGLSLFQALRWLPLVALVHTPVDTRLRPVFSDRRGVETFHPRRLLVAQVLREAVAICFLLHCHSIDRGFFVLSPPSVGWFSPCARGSLVPLRSALGWPELKGSGCAWVNAPAVQVSR